MKIISTPLHLRYNGIVNATSEFFNINLWHPDSQPIFDIFDIVKPDVVYCDIKYVNKTFMKACSEYKDIKIVLFSNMIPRYFEPHLVCAEPSLSSMLKKHLSQGSHKTLYLHDSADVVTYHGDDTQHKLFKSDIAYYSIGTMAEGPIQKIRLFSKLDKLGVFKIAGPTRIPLPYYLGGVIEKQAIPFLKASKIAIDWNGENLLNQAANGIFTLSTTHNDLCPTIDMDNLKDQITSFLSNDKARNKIAKKARKNILSKDTCYHRLKDILQALELDDQIQEIDYKIQGLL